MKRIVLLITFFLVYVVFTVSSVYAAKQEWYASSFNFTQAKKIAVLFRPSDRLGALQANEAYDLFMEKMKNDLIDELPAGQYEFASGHVIAQKIFQESGTDIAAIAKTDLPKADAIAYDYIQKHYDLFVVWVPLIYDVGSQYCEGYVYTLPSMDTSTVWLPNGQAATIITNGQTVHNVPGGNYPAVYVAVRADVINPKDSSPVWIWMDDRVRVNQTVFDNTKPKDVYRRILGRFIEDVHSTLKERKGIRTHASF